MDQGSVALDTGLSVDYDLATPVGLLSFFPLLFFHTDPRSLFARSNLSTGFVLCPCIEAQRDQGSVRRGSKYFYHRYLSGFLYRSDPRSIGSHTI
jgi:hypothetical protein